MAVPEASTAPTSIWLLLQGPYGDARPQDELPDWSPLFGTGSFGMLHATWPKPGRAEAEGEGSHSGLLPLPRCSSLQGLI